ncbi:galactokinase [Gleimia sp. 6138-11-ORH1]|uniref:galactokinase n=1 Tax=Gleimia sp. 6138-11-ORH1 TaxID=2973937 RepID=UPI0021670AD8|nr:galactokinase [Gleimia sp. 6138-11-ORH1]MCS4485207.1 galactokinase [Gleimia sp. 6138-11-ORH1]
MVTLKQAFSLTEGATQVTTLFTETFGYAPTAVHSAPGRVNVIGEHTDYNGGYALPMALPHRTYVAVAPRTDRLVRLISAQESGVREVSLDQVDTFDSANPVSGWPAYVVGVAWALEQAGYGPYMGLDIAVDSCVPFGAGLSSSAALECAVAAAWDTLQGGALLATDSGRAVLVNACVQAENQIAGAPTGGMDQAASLRCQAGHVIFLDCRDQTVQHLPFDLNSADLELLVVDTRAPHALVDGQYAARRQACETAASILGVALLVELPAGSYHELPAWQQLSAVQQARVRHVVTEIARTKEFASLLTEGAQTGNFDWERLGALMNASHESLRVDYEVTCPELDTMVEAARGAGALGARMTGGGFGGSAIALVHTKDVPAVTQAVTEAFAQAGFNEPHFLRAFPAEAAF